MKKEVAKKLRVQAAIIYNTMNPKYRILVTEKKIYKRLKKKYTLIIVGNLNLRILLRCLLMNLV